VPSWFDPGLDHELCLAASSLVIGMLDNIAGEDIAESLPSLTIEFHELHLFDRKKSSGPVLILMPGNSMSHSLSNTKSRKQPHAK
jgi:hypothetical protein